MNRCLRVGRDPQERGIRGFGDVLVTTHSGQDHQVIADCEALRERTPRLIARRSCWSNRLDEPARSWHRRGASGYGQRGQPRQLDDAPLFGRFEPAQPGLDLAASSRSNRRSALIGHGGASRSEAAHSEQLR